MEKIYISGKITGIENEAPKLFARAEYLFLSQGYDVINPITLNHNHNLSWLNYMRVDVVALVYCDSIYMLDNWLYSKGAIVEYKIAKMLGLKIKYEQKPNIIKKWLYLNFKN